MVFMINLDQIVCRFCNYLDYIEIQDIVKEMLKSRQAQLHNCSYGDGTNTGAAFQQLFFSPIKSQKRRRPKLCLMGAEENLKPLLCEQKFGHEDIKAELRAFSGSSPATAELVSFFQFINLEQPRAVCRIRETAICRLIMMFKMT